MPAQSKVSDAASTQSQRVREREVSQPMTDCDQTKNSARFAEENHNDCSISARVRLMLRKEISRTHPATSARLLFWTWSASTDETSDASKTHPSTRKSFPSVLVMKDSANSGAITSMQNAVLTMVCSASRTPLSE